MTLTMTMTIYDVTNIASFYWISSEHSKHIYTLVSQSVKLDSFGTFWIQKWFKWLMIMYVLDKNCPTDPNHLFPKGSDFINLL